MTGIASLSLVSSQKAWQVCEHVPLGQSSRQILKPEQTPSEYLGLLLAHRAYDDAVKFLSSGLPTREAVWWACCCIREVPELSAEAATVSLASAEEWVQDPSEEKALVAKESADEAGYEMPVAPASWTALAAAIAGESAWKPIVQEEPPAESLAAQLVAGAILGTATFGDPETFEKCFKQFLEKGVAIANGQSGLKDNDLQEESVADE